MTYTKAELEALWAGVNPGNGNPHLMAAIALAESSGNPSSENSIGACGLWQIHPYEQGCLNPTTNARMAGEKLRTQGLGAWETYTNGAYKQYLTGGTTSGQTKDVLLGIPFTPELPGESIPNEILEGNVPNPAKPFEQGANLLGTLGKIPGDFDKIYHLLFTPEGWMKIGKVLLGVFLLMTGVLGLANVSSTNVIVQGGKKVAEVGGAVVAAS